VEYSIDKPLSPEQATALINAIPQYANRTIQITSHCRERMLERNFTFNDLLMLLTNGVVRSFPEKDETHGHYKYKVEGPTVDEDEAIAITVILGPRSVRILSIY
jgi:hypothetical protein